MKNLISLFLVSCFSITAHASFSFTSIRCSAEIDMSKTPMIYENLMLDLEFRPVTPKKAGDPNVELMEKATGVVSQVPSKPIIRSGYIFEASDFSKSTNTNNYTFAYSQDKDDHTKAYKLVFNKASLRGFAITHEIDQHTKFIDSYVCELKL